MPIPLLIAGAAILIGAKAHSKANEVNEEAESIAEKAQRMYQSQQVEARAAQKRVIHELEKLGQQKQMILLYPMKSFLETYSKLKKVGLLNSQGIEELENLPQFSFGDQDVVQIEQLTNIYESVRASAADGAVAGALAGLAVTGTGGLLSAAGAAGTFSAAGVAGVALDAAGTAIGAVAAAPLSLFVAPVAVFTGLSALSKANDNLSKAKANLAQVELAGERTKNLILLSDGIVKKANMFEKIMMDLTKLFAQCIVLQNAIIRKKQKKKQTISREDFTDDELKVFAVSRSLAGALKALIDVPILNNGEVSEEADQKYKTVMESLPSYENNIQEAKAITKGLKVNAEKEQKLLIEPVEKAIEEEDPELLGRKRPTGLFTNGWSNTLFVFFVRLLIALLMFRSMYYGIKEILYQFIILIVISKLGTIERKYSFWHKRRAKFIDRIYLCWAGFLMIRYGYLLISNQSRYLVGGGMILFGIGIGFAGWELGTSDDEGNDDIYYSSIALLVPVVMLVAGIIRKFFW